MPQEEWKDAENVDLQEHAPLRGSKGADEAEERSEAKETSLERDVEREDDVPRSQASRKELIG